MKTPVGLSLCPFSMILCKNGGYPAKKPGRRGPLRAFSYGCGAASSVPTGTAGLRKNPQNPGYGGQNAPGSGGRSLTSGRSAAGVCKGGRAGNPRRQKCRCGPPLRPPVSAGILGISPRPRVPGRRMRFSLPLPPLLPRRPPSRGRRPPAPLRNLPRRPPRLPWAAPRGSRRGCRPRPS